MSLLASIFSDFKLPNATTWFYFALLLAVALFFKFSRVFSLRNWDVLTLFLLVPGMLLRQEATLGPQEADAAKTPTATPSAAAAPTKAGPSAMVWFAYLWLLCGAGYFFFRCLADLGLVRRPALSPNLNFAGLAWLGAALLIFLVAQSLKRPVEVAAQTPADSNNNAKNGGTPAAKPADAADDADFMTSVYVRRWMAIVGHLGLLAALVFIGWKHFDDVHTGMAMATFYLLLPYTAQFFDQVQHVLPMALVLWAVAVYPWPTAAGLLLGLAAGCIYLPALIFPVWLSFYWRRGAVRFTCATLAGAALGLAIVGFIIWLGGPLGSEVQSTLNVFDVQQWKQPSTEGIWTGVHWAYRIPVFIAYAAFLVTTLFWPQPKNLAHLLALSAALLIGIQFWFADRGGLYVLWYVPLVLLLSFRPNLADREALPIIPETDWLRHLRQRLIHIGRRLLRLPEPLAPVENRPAA
jgi:hypothetical protein